MNISFTTDTDRREVNRIFLNMGVVLSFQDLDLKDHDMVGQIQNLSPKGFSCLLQESLPKTLNSLAGKLVENPANERFMCVVVWRSKSGNKYGLRFSRLQNELWDSLLRHREKYARPESFSRRSKQRRIGEKPVVDNKRKNDRRFPELARSFLEVPPTNQPGISRIFNRNKVSAYSEDALDDRRSLLKKSTGIEFKHVTCFSESPKTMRGKIENAIGVAHVPLGVAGPLRVHGEFARGDFYVPLATSEGALVSSYTLGMNLVTHAGGVNTYIIQDEIRVSPVFIFSSLREAQAFIQWIWTNFNRIKVEAESTTSHGKLVRLEPLIHGHRVILKFWFSTGDAMGMNMICKATDQACKMIVSSVKPLRYYLRSNYSSNKKISINNIITGYGKTVTADVVIPRKLLQIFNVKPEQMQTYFQDSILSSLFAGMVGANGHIANGLTALFIACGQDVATIVNAGAGISFCEVLPKGDLYVSTSIPNLLVGTVGGGTEFGTSKECLSLMDCWGEGKAKKFAEIATATALAGEISISISIINGTYVNAHELYGRNYPNSH